MSMFSLLSPTFLFETIKKFRIQSISHQMEIVKMNQMYFEFTELKHRPSRIYVFDTKPK